MTEIKTVLPALTFENGIMTNYSDLLSVAEEYKSLPDVIVTAQQGSRTNAVKSDLKKNADLIKKSLKEEDKLRSAAFYEENHGAVAALDTLISVREDLVERTNTWERERLEANMPVLEEFVSEQNDLHDLDAQHKLKADNWRKLGTFTATGKIVNKIQNEIVMRARLAEVEQNEKPKPTEFEIYQINVKRAFSKLFEEFSADELYTGRDFQNSLTKISEFLK
ncbi:hypothetical protein KII95_08645 [Leuconostoc gelidum subsp. aenigmaticum]|uniref:hypothetical protein n=1 Tax=Leuconostoc gelidum TaxID=1244 RepID=UPI001CC424DF|nr:hypothetical protein [Leuconostoc gelidum]MBZ6004076.1 hypothetical protein [Leuconostoc gelidum subsp. aenigmaticum]